MASLAYFTVVGTYLAALHDSIYDVDNDPELTPMSGTVTFTPLIDTGDSLPAPTLTPPANLWLVPIKAQIKSGVVTSNGATGIKLVANTAVLALSGNLFYRVDFYDGLLAGGKTYHPDSFTFQAPTSATTMDLVTVTPVAGQPAQGAGVGAVTSVAGRTGAILLNVADLSDATAIGKALVMAADQAAVQTIVGAVTSTWSTISGKPAVIAAGADQAAARSAIGALSSTEIGALITTAVNGLLNGAPGALDTLKELADAINDDASFAASVTTALGGKVSRTSTPLQMYGTDGAGAQITGTYSDAATANTLALRGTGGTLAVGDATLSGHAATKSQVDAKAPLTSPTFTGTVVGVTKAMVGLGNVDNTADTTKTVLAATKLTSTLAASGDTTGAADTTAINAAITAASTAGGGTVALAAGNFYTAGVIVPKTGVRLTGTSGTTIRSAQANGKIIQGTTTSFDGFAIDGITFIGSVTTTMPTVPTRARTAAATGADYAVWLSGDLDTTGSSTGVLQNFTMTNCTVKNMAALPLRIAGVRGTVRVSNCRFENNQDVGFIFNQEVIFADNHIHGSADNGVSISRGNNKVTCTGNTVENSCYNGIWISGFGTDTGPTHFTVTGNTITTCGHNGIKADSAPKFGVISSNDIDGGFYRGPVDELTDLYGAGIYLGGLPLANRSTSTDWATGITVVGNHIRQMARAGVYVTQSKMVAVHSNVLTDIGTQFLADGTTTIISTNTTTNVGVLIEGGTSTDISVQSNVVYDERGTPYCNQGVIPQTPASTHVYAWNHMAGCRTAFNLFDSFAGATREITSTMRFDVAARMVGGAVSGSDGATGDVLGFHANGAATSRRGFRFNTASVLRWWLRSNGTAESGSNAGSDLELAAYADNGSTEVAVALAVARATGAVTIGAGNAVPVTLRGRRVASAASVTIGNGTVSTGAAAASNGANDSSGYITATSTASPSAASIATVVYGTPYSTIPKVVVTARNPATALSNIYVTGETVSGFTVSAASAPAASAALAFGYHVEG